VCGGPPRRAGRRRGAAGIRDCSKNRSYGRSEPLPAAELDPVKLWGEEAATNARLVDMLLMKLQDEDYLEIESYVLRVPAVANFVLGVVKRQAKRYERA
jgi:hypothetical protein